MYSLPRFASHLSDASVASLREVYRSAFAPLGAGNFAVLDLCSSWASHFPAELVEGSRVAVLGMNELELHRNLQATERVAAKYNDLSQKVQEVPHFVLRESTSGNGVEVNGTRSVSEWDDVIQRVLQKGELVGMSVPGPHGRELRLAEGNPTGPVSLAFAAQHQWAPEVFPFAPADFARADESDGEATFDFVTLAMSVQYLTRPQELFSEIHRVLKPGGMAIVAYSNRCFIEKTVNVWAREVYDGEGHAHVLRAYFLHSPLGGWSGISSADVSPRQKSDPLWIVTAVKAK